MKKNLEDNLMSLLNAARMESKFDEGYNYLKLFIYSHHHITVSFENLHALSKTFKTKSIEVNEFKVKEGCGSCGYGSFHAYGIDICDIPDKIVAKYSLGE